MILVKDKPTFAQWKQLLVSSCIHPKAIPHCPAREEVSGCMCVCGREAVLMTILDCTLNIQQVKLPVWQDQ